MKKIDNIEIKNFKSIRHAEIKDCRRINVFIGYPNTGKSNILEALGLFGLNNIAPDIDVREFLRFETYMNLFYNNNIKNSIQVRLGRSEQIELKVVNKKLHFRSESDKMFFEMEIPLTDYRIDAMAHGSDASEEYDSLERMQIKKYSFTEVQRNYPLRFLNELSFPFGENLADIINSNQELKKSVVEIFKSYNLKYATDENNSMRIIKEYGDQEVKIFPYIQIADTLRRLIFYKAAIKSNNRNVLLFEEPEAHMFPPYISKFTSDLVNDENNNQFFITTHSPFVLNDLIENASEDLAIYTVEYKKETGETMVHKMSEDEMHEAYQFGYDFFLNIKNFLPQS